MAGYNKYKSSGGQGVIMPEGYECVGEYTISPDIIGNPISLDMDIMLCTDGKIYNKIPGDATVAEPE